MENNFNAYTLDQIKLFINSNMLIDENMCKKIVASLSQHEINTEIAEILKKLSEANITPQMKENLKAASESATKYLTVVSANNAAEEVVVTNEDKKTEQERMTNEQMLQKTLGNATKNGMTVVEADVNKDRTPHITFDINPESKPYIDNLLLNMCEEKGIDLELSKINASNKELFTIAVDDKNLTLEQKQDKVNDVLSKVNEIIETTNKNKDYEELLPGKVKRMKQGFVNDQPDVNEEDYSIGFNNKGGVDNYYIVTSSKARAEEIAKELGYELEAVVDGNKFRIKSGDQKIDGTKLEQEAEYVNITNNQESKETIVEQAPVSSKFVEEKKEEPKIDNFSNYMAGAAIGAAIGSSVMATNPVMGATVGATVGGAMMSDNEPNTQTMSQNKVMQKKLGSYPSNFDNAAYTTYYMVLITVCLAVAAFVAFKYLF